MGFIFNCWFDYLNGLLSFGCCSSETDHRQRFVVIKVLVLTLTSSLAQLNVGSYLQLLCLAEDLRTDPHDVCSLLSLNRCDIRQSMLQLQFWTRSSGGRCITRPLGNCGENGEEISIFMYTLALCTQRYFCRCEFKFS